jgi:pimeloyl-ACP methyl ester carboxylesterase
VAAVSQAGVLDLAAGAREGLGSGAVQALLGGEPGDHPDRYAVASPAALVPLGIPQLLLHGAGDEIVPPSQSSGYASGARAEGDDVELVVLEADHFAVIDPAHAAWALAAGWLAARLVRATNP